MLSSVLNKTQRRPWCITAVTQGGNRATCRQQFSPKNIFSSVDLSDPWLVLAEILAKTFVFLVSCPSSLLCKVFTSWLKKPDRLIHLKEAFIANIVEQSTWIKNTLSRIRGVDLTTCDLCTRDSLGLLSANLAPPAFPALLHSDQPEEDDDVDGVGGRAMRFDWGAKWCTSKVLYVWKVTFILRKKWKLIWAAGLWLENNLRNNLNVKEKVKGEQNNLKMERPTCCLITLLQRSISGSGSGSRPPWNSLFIFFCSFYLSHSSCSCSRPPWNSLFITFLSHKLSLCSRSTRAKNLFQKKTSGNKMLVLHVQHINLKRQNIPAENSPKYFIVISQWPHTADTIG